MNRRIWVGATIGILVVVSSGAAWASDASAAKTLVLTKADIGSGYTQSPATSNGDTFSQIATCVGMPTNRVVATTVDGSAFTDAKTGASISSTVDIVTTKAMAKADRAIVTSTKFPDCIAQLVKTQLAGQGQVSATAERVSVKKYGDFSYAVATTVGVVVAGTTQHATIVDVLIQKGRAEIQASFVTFTSQPFDQATGQAMLDKLAPRIKKAAV